MTPDPGLDTPLAPLPAPEQAAPSPPAVPRRPSRAAWGARFALSAWRPLLAVLVVQLLLGLTVALPFQAGLGARLDEHPHAAALGGAPTASDRALGWEAGMDAGLWRDAKRQTSALLDALPTALLGVLLVAWLFGAVAAGGFLGLALEGGPRSTSSFFGHGGRLFFRMLRVGLTFFVLFVLVSRLVHEGWGAALKDSEAQAASEGAGWWGERAREALLLVLFLALRVACDLARVDLASGVRRSAVLACLRRLGSVVRHPLQTLGAAALLGVPAFAALYGLSRLLDLLPQGGWGGVLALFLVLEVAVLLRWASRAALLGAFTRPVLPAAFPPPATP